MAPQNMVGLALARRWEKRSRSNFYWRVKKCASLVYDMEVLKHFVEECAGSIQLGDIGTFGSTRTFCMKN